MTEPLPLSALRTSHGVRELAKSGSPLLVLVDDEFADPLGEQHELADVFLLQRLLTVATLASEIRFLWPPQVAEVFSRSPNLHPVLAAICALRNAHHDRLETDPGAKTKPFDLGRVRRVIEEYRLTSDLFSNRQIVICADSLGRGRPRELYDASTGSIRPFEDIDATLINILWALAPGVAIRRHAFELRSALGVIVWELFGNTEAHGKLSLAGDPILPNGVRGLMFSLTHRLERRGRRERVPNPYLDVSIFDSGIGFFESRMREPLTEDTPSELEWSVLHVCMDRHHHAHVPGASAGYRGMGLYEVLRALKRVKGFIEIRTGRVHGYRSFLEGALPIHLESQVSPDRPGMPKPVLLDFTKQFARKPTIQERVVGSAIRILIPLAW